MSKCVAPSPKPVTQAIFEFYQWSSGQSYFTEEKKLWLDAVYVEDLFGHNQAFLAFVDAQTELDELPVIKTSMGLIIGGEDYVPQALEQANRREALNYQTPFQVYRNGLEKAAS